MEAKDAVKIALTSTQDMLGRYLSDLSDSDLLVRPVPGANHVAWQLGHLIASEQAMGKELPGVEYPKLPAGFMEQHSNDTAKAEPAKGFRTKDEYVKLFNQTRQATLNALANMSNQDLDRPTSGNMAKWAPTLGHLLVLTANHTMMHAGQFTAVRRKQGKPVLF